MMKLNLSGLLKNIKQFANIFIMKSNKKKGMQIACPFVRSYFSSAPSWSQQLHFFEYNTVTFSSSKWSIVALQV